MKERPIIFGAESVRAILTGRKTQTRRVVIPQPQRLSPSEFRSGAFLCDADWILSRCPYGMPGDRLWVRETWLYVGPGSGSDLPDYVAEREKPENHVASHCWYRADPSWDQGDPDALRWSSPIFMPRWASRLLLEVAAVRVERLQDVSEEDAIAEGAPSDIEGQPGRPFGPLALMNFARGWDALNAKRGYGWASNPWVWAITFRRLDQAAARASA